MRIQHFLHDNAHINSIVIWGNGQLGNSIRRHIESMDEGLKTVYTIDSATKEAIEKNGITVFPISALPDLSFDCLIIASIEYESEIMATIEHLYPRDIEKVYSFSTDPQLEKLKETDLQSLSLESLVELVFAFPDCAEVWHALSHNTSGDIALAYADCAKALNSR
ncbi:hypothetical protein [Alteromonas facilis]|uniref:hypothetical protein n=1 Tax=Alteromonas facilis TaxID=2048004 RepID=UPI000F5C3E11|nr:hypothetical protein [Alteromonas facilis]